MNEPSLRLRLTVWSTLALYVTLCLGAPSFREQAASACVVSIESSTPRGTLTGVLGDELRETQTSTRPPRRRTGHTGARSAVAILDASGHPLAAHSNRLDPGGVPPRQSLPPRLNGGITARNSRVHAVPQSPRRTRSSYSSRPRCPTSGVSSTRTQNNGIDTPIVLPITVAADLYLASVGLRPSRFAAQLRQVVADASHKLPTPVLDRPRIRRRHAQPRASRRRRISRGPRDCRRPSAATRPVRRRHAGRRARRRRGPALRPVDLSFDEIVADCSAPSACWRKSGTTIRSGQHDRCFGIWRQRPAAPAPC